MDILDEAEQQANCLAGYADKFADGDVILVFMKKASNENKSYISIALDKEGNKIQQAYYARNRQVTPNDYAVIERWLKRVQRKIELGLSEDNDEYLAYAE